MEPENLDLLVLDFQAAFLVEAADRCGLPCIHHGPVPYMVIDVMLELQTPSLYRTTSWCGFLCISPHYLDAIIKGFSVVFGQPKAFYDKTRTFQHRTVLCSTFFGMDKPALMPPNFIVHGPVMKPLEGMMKALSEKDPELYQWLEDALRLK